MKLRIVRGARDDLPPFDHPTGLSKRGVAELRRFHRGFVEDDEPVICAFFERWDAEVERALPCFKRLAAVPREKVEVHLLTRLFLSLPGCLCWGLSIREQVRAQLRMLARRPSFHAADRP